VLPGRCRISAAPARVKALANPVPVVIRETAGIQCSRSRCYALSLRATKTWPVGLKVVRPGDGAEGLRRRPAWIRCVVQKTGRGAASILLGAGGRGCQSAVRRGAGRYRLASSLSRGR
jgi:hypothetical protein